MRLASCPHPPGVPSSARLPGRNTSAAGVPPPRTLPALPLHPTAAPGAGVRAREDATSAAALRWEPGRPAAASRDTAPSGPPPPLPPGPTPASTAAAGLRRKAADTA